MLVVVADHGISFTAEQAPRYVSHDNEAQTMWSPLFVKDAGQARGATRPIARSSPSIIMPTIADGLGVEMPFETDGIAHRPRRNEPRGSVATWTSRANGCRLAERSGFDEMLRPDRPGDSTPRRSASGRVGRWENLVGQPTRPDSPSHAGRADEMDRLAVSGPQRYSTTSIVRRRRRADLRGRSRCRTTGSDRFHGRRRRRGRGDRERAASPGGPSSPRSQGSCAGLFRVTMPPELLVERPQPLGGRRDSRGDDHRGAVESGAVRRCRRFRSGSAGSRLSRRRRGRPPPGTWHG